MGGGGGGEGGSCKTGETEMINNARTPGRKAVIPNKPWLKRD